MTIEHPLFMQANDYSARLTRLLIESVFAEGVLDGFAVSQRGAGANMSVDVTGGVALVDGDDQSHQHTYLVESTATENISGFTAPGANSRIDLIVLQVNDPNAGGSSGSNMQIVRVAGTPAASPVAPSVPASALALAEIGPITTSTTEITDDMITMVAERAKLRYDVVDDENATRLGTSSAVADTIVRRSATTGQIALADPTIPTHVATKGYVDGLAARSGGYLGPNNEIRYDRYGSGTGALVVVRSNPLVPASPLSVTLPAGYRPATEVYAPIVYGSTNARVVGIGTSGAIGLSNPGGGEGGAFVAVFTAA